MDDVVRPYALSHGFGRIPCSMSSDLLCCPKALMTCHDRVVRLCELSKGYVVMQQSVLSGRVGCPRDIMACHARRRLSVNAIQRLRRHSMPDFVRLCVLSKGDDGMPRSMLSDHVYYPRAMME